MKPISARTRLAREEASNSTGRVTRLKSMITAQAAAMIQEAECQVRRPVKIPTRGNHMTIWLAKFVAVTAAMRRWRGA